MKSEINDLSIKLKKIGLEEYDVDGDGNCLFRAISHQLYGSDRSHLQLRSQAVDYIQKNQDDFTPFLEEPLSKYVARMSKSGVYGGNLELVALSKVMNLNIVIYQSQSDPLVIQSPQSSDKTIYIIYYSYEHYSSTIKSSNSEFNPPKLIDAKASKKSQDMINQIIKISGYSNVEKIHELLQKHDGKFGLVLDDIYELDHDQELDIEEIKTVVKDDSIKIVKSRDRKKLAKSKRKEAALEKKRNKTKNSDNNSDKSNIHGIEQSLKGIHI
jgi:hypothetical protein